jgi:hypothetical protein
MEKSKVKAGSSTRKTFDRFTKENIYSWNTTHRRKVLECEALSLSDGCHPWFKRSTSKKNPVIRLNNSNDYSDDNNNNNNNNIVPTKNLIVYKMSEMVIN